MITYCSKCGINWSELWNETDDGEETVEYCPVCKTNHYLEDGNDIHGHIKCHITGRIFNTFTGQDVTYNILSAPVHLTDKKVKIWDETWEEFQLRKEAAEDVYILTGNYEKPERKFHY